MYDILKRKCTDQIAKCNYYINTYAEDPIETAICRGKIQAYENVLKQIKYNEQNIKNKRKSKQNNYNLYKFIKQL